MANLIDLSKIEVPGWTILGHAGGSYWNLRRNDCGHISKKRSADIRSGSVFFACKHCGKNFNSKHGHCARGKVSDTYRSWAGMMNRCKAGPGTKDYPVYMGRGIAVCERWKEFSNFLADMGERPGKESTVDRIDNDLGYFPGNCHWVTIAENQLNKRNNKWVLFNGRKMVIEHVVKLTGVSRYQIYKKIGKQSGCSPDVTAFILFSGKSIPIQIQQRAVRNCA